MLSTGTVTRVDVSGSAPADLLATKLAIPQPPPGLVTRSRLVQRLDEGASDRVTLVSAGPGWGKTMLAASWANTLPSSQPLAWLSLDSYDNDPVLFWAYLLSAIRAAGEVVGGSLSNLAINPPIGQEVLRRIIVGLGKIERPLVLVLDDFGEIHNPDILEGVAGLLRHPMPLRLVLLTRTDPRLPLYRLRVEGKLSEIRVADLAFTEDEASALLHRSGVTLTTHLTRRVMERTEGWAVGLRLAALFAAQPGQADRIEEFTGDEGAVAEYLLEEVLAEVSPEQRSFLLRTAVADRLCAELADELCDSNGGQRQLEELAQANAFVVALGPGHRWFRYHPLMAELLRYRLLLDEPALVPELHRRAAHWFAARSEALEAVRHAVRAQDWQLVGELIVTLAAVRAVSGERQAFDALLADIPVHEFQTSPELRLCAALRCFIARDYIGFASQVDQARAMAAERPTTTLGATQVFLRVADLVLARLSGDISGLIEASKELLGWGLVGDGFGHRAAAQYQSVAVSNLGVGLVWSARDKEADPHLHAALSSATESGTDLTLVNSYAYLGLLELTRGQVGAAHTYASHGLELAERSGGIELAQSIMIFAVLAAVELEHHDVAAAQTHLDAALAALHNDPEPTSGVAVQALQARLFLDSGRITAARAAMTRLRAGSLDIQPPELLAAWLATTDAEIDLATGQPESAWDRLSSFLDGQTVATDGLRTCAARASLALRQFAAAAELARSVADTSTNPVVGVSAWLVVAAAADQQRDDHRALAALDRALELAEPDNIRRPFVVLAHPRLGSILRHRLRLGTGGPFATGVAADLDSGGPAAALPPVSEPLTDRERVVLSHLATLQTNGEIAVELCISVNTVKAHARTAYRKLNASNRREAVKRARDLGII